jgi:hypothetical protein
MYSLFHRFDGLFLQLCLTLTALDCVQASLLRVPLRVCLVALVLVLVGLNVEHSPLMNPIGYPL